MNGEKESPTATGMNGRASRDNFAGRAIPTIPDSIDHGPYALAARIYYDAGWLAPIPVDTYRPGLVLEGTTGGKNLASYPPSMEQLAEWWREWGRGNVGLWLPDDVIGIDVDAYDCKTGARTIEWIETNITREPLPPTYTSTCRGPGQPSRIWFYRVPAGRSWTPVLQVRGKTRADDLGHVEIIQHRHRWARVWPSFKTDKEPAVRGCQYRWYDPTGAEVPHFVVPRPDELTLISGPWLAAVTRGRGESSGGPLPDMTKDEVYEWLDTLHDAGESGRPCMKVRATLARHAGKLGRPGSRHESMTGGVWALVRDGAAGHRGVREALLELYAEFETRTVWDGSRSPAGALAEWQRAVEPAVKRTSESGLADPCSCDIYDRWTRGLGGAL